MIPISFKRAYQKFTKLCTPIVIDAEKINVESLFQIMAKEYQKPIFRIDKNNPDNDMLLFEYGNYDWTDNEPKFNFSLKRQVFLKNYEEPGFYGFRIYFETQIIGIDEKFSKWCRDKESLTEWLKEIKETDGFQKVQNIKFENVDFELEKPY